MKLLKWCAGVLSAIIILSFIIIFIVVAVGIYHDQLKKLSVLLICLSILSPFSAATLVLLACAAQPVDISGYREMIIHKLVDH